MYPGSKTESSYYDSRQLYLIIYQFKNATGAKNKSVQWNNKPTNVQSFHRLMTLSMIQTVLSICIES